MNQLQIFKNELFEVGAKIEGDAILFDVEQVAVSLGLTKTENKNGKIYTSVRWQRVNEYLGFRPQVGEKKSCPEVGKGDFIPEPMVYKLAFKASNEAAEQFQDWLAIEVIPSIRKYGTYQVKQDPITLALEAALETRKSVQTIQSEVSVVKADIEELKDNIYIASVQAKAIKNKVGEKVYEALGGKESNAFKHLKSKIFAACWRDFKNYFDISEYRELPRVKFELGMKFLFAWQPSTELRLEIEHYNTQLQLKLVK